MKKILFTAITAAVIGLGLTCCGNKNKVENSNKANSTEISADSGTVSKLDLFPWDFPKEFKLEGVELGQEVLAPSGYKNAIEKNKDLLDNSNVFYNFTVTRVPNNKTLFIKMFGDEFEIPNPLVIPIPKGQKAKVGDIVLTWWQSGSGMQRAIVTDASDPETPKVCYLDLNYEDDGKGFANEHANEQLKPNSFLVMKNGEWMSGATVAVMDDGEWKKATILNVTDDKVLVIGFIGKIKAYKRSDCKLIPLVPEYKVGDHVKAVFLTGFANDYKVTKIDQKIGRVWVEHRGKIEPKSILEVVKDL